MTPQVFRGIGVSPGVAIGRALVVEARRPHAKREILDAARVPTEVTRLRKALDDARHQIVEVGNLAASGLGTARTLIVKLTRQLALQGFRWVTFTGTQELLNSFHRLGLAPQSLGLADPARMGPALADWGRYYDSQPQVVYGEILPAHRQLAEAQAPTDLSPFPFTHRVLQHAA